MPICIECRYPVKTLYTTYSKADDRSLGKGVRLTQCPRCKRFADKYVEHDFVVLFIDLVLIKPQVYRHLLFNRLSPATSSFSTQTARFDPSILRLGILLLLFDVYLTWARIEKTTPQSTSLAHPLPVTPNTTSLSTQPLVLQYCFFLALCTAETLAFHVPIRVICGRGVKVPSWLRNKGEGSTSESGSNDTSTAPIASPDATPTVPPQPFVSGASTPTGPMPSGAATPFPSVPPTPTLPKVQEAYLLPYYPLPHLLSTALLVSSCTKLFPILLIIWDYDLPSSASAVSWAVIVNNIAALEILMDCGYLRAGILVAIGAACRGLVAAGVLGAVGLGEGFAWGWW